jgi:hypothetical protein
LEIITTGVPTVNQALLNAGATKIVLNSALEGAAIKYGTLQAKTNVLSMGIQNALGTLVGKTLQFSGEGCLTETGVSLWVNTYIQLDGAFSISTGGGDQTVNAKIVTPAGKKDGIEFFAKAA